MKRIILASALLALFGCGGKPAQVAPPPPALPVITLKPESVITHQFYPASIQGVDEVEIRPQVNGILEKVFVDEGALVSAGQPLFKIDPQPYLAVLGNATASLHAAEGSAANTDLEIQKLTPLVNNKVVSDFQLKTAQSSNRVALANIEQAKATIRTAQINLGYTVIKAPVSGYVGRLLRKKGSLIAPSDPDALTSVSDVHDVHVYFSLSENDFAAFKARYAGTTLAEKLKQIPPVTLILSDNSIYEYKGKIDIVDGRFDKNTAAITLRAVFKNPKGILRTGNTGKVQLDLPFNNSIMIPQSATVELQDKIFVFMLADSNKVKKQPVTVSSREDKNYLISSGLKPGDRIVTDGILTLQDGMVITPQPVTATPVTANKN